MANKREITLDVDEDQKILLCEALTLYAHKEKPPNPDLYELKAKINLAWVEAEFRDESDARNDWVNREMYGKEVRPDPT